MVRHELLERGPHLEADGEDKGLERAAIPPLHFSDDVLGQADHSQQHDDRRRGLECILNECLRGL